MSDILNVAVVGLGVGRSHLEEGFATNGDRFRVVAVCDTNTDRLHPVADQFGVERRVTDFDDLLAMEDLDVIDICTPPMLHFPMVMAALKAGKHVICEKPLVGSLAQIDEVIAQEKVSKGKLMPVFQYRFGDGVLQAKAIVDAGIAGIPFVGTVETLWERGADYYAVPWRGKWATELGGVLMTHAIHQHDLFTYLMGDIKRLFGRVATRVNPIEVEDCVTASLELENGALGSFTATLGSVGNISRLRFAFENVTFESDHEAYNPGDKPWRIEARTPEIKARIDELLRDWQHVPSRYQSQMVRFHDSIVNGLPLPVTTADARRALEIVTAFYHSATSHEDVSMPIEKKHPYFESWIPVRI